MTIYSLINRICDQLVNQVMQSVHISPTNVHLRTQSDPLYAFQCADLRLSIFAFWGARFVGICHRW